MWAWAAMGGGIETCQVYVLEEVMGEGGKEGERGREERKEGGEGRERREERGEGG